MLKFRSGGKTYTAAALTRPSIRDYLRLEKQTEELAQESGIGHKWTSTQVFDLEAAIAGCKSAKERSDHPDFLFFLAVIVWATMIEEHVPDPFDKAIDTRLDDLDFFYESDQPQVAVDPAKPRAARASARGAKHPAAKAAVRAKTSKKRSTAAS